MGTRKLEEIAEALRESGIPPAFGPDLSRLLIRLWRLLAAGRPIPPERVEQEAAALNMARDEAVSVISQVSERDQAGRITGLVGLSLDTHPHQFQVDGQRMNTWCAWDTLFLPVMLQQTAVVESLCPATQQLVRLTITPKRVERCDPPSAVVSMVTPQVTQSGPRAVEEIWMTFCHQVHFFSSAESASEWQRKQNIDMQILSIEEGYRLGRMAFEELLPYASGA